MPARTRWQRGPLLQAGLLTLHWRRHLSACLAVALAMATAGCVQRYTLDKVGADADQQRVDWGLCGGDFLPAGSVQIAADDSDAVLICMKEKGYTVRSVGLFGK